MRDFSLTFDQVPDPPDGGKWMDVLRWCICVMDPKDTRLSFIAGCLSYALVNDGLTQKQAAACQSILDRLIDDFGRGILVCQNTEARDDYDAFPPVNERMH